MFEHFVVVGLPPNADMEAVERALKARKIWEMSAERAGKSVDEKDYKGPFPPALEAEVGGRRRCCLC